MVSGTFNPSGLDKKVIISSSWTSQAPLPPVLKRPKTKKQRKKKRQKNKLSFNKIRASGAGVAKGVDALFGCCFVRMPHNNKL